MRSPCPCAATASEIFPQDYIRAAGNFPYPIEDNDPVHKIKLILFIKRVFLGIAVDLQERVFGLLCCLTLIRRGKGEVFPVLIRAVMDDRMSEIEFHSVLWSPHFLRQRACSRPPRQ